MLVYGAWSARGASNIPAPTLRGTLPGFRPKRPKDRNPQKSKIPSFQKDSPEIRRSGPRDGGSECAQLPEYGFEGRGFRLFGGTRARKGELGTHRKGPNWTQKAQAAGLRRPCSPVGSEATREWLHSAVSSVFGCSGFGVLGNSGILEGSRSAGPTEPFGEFWTFRRRHDAVVDLGAPSGC